MTFRTATHFFCSIRNREVGNCLTANSFNGDITYLFELQYQSSCEIHISDLFHNQ